VAQIRPYRERDAERVGQLIPSTYARFSLTFASPDELGDLLGPFQHAWSPLAAHRRADAEAIRAPTVLVATDSAEIVGVPRGRDGRLASLFVRGDHHRKGIGSALVGQFEAECLRRGAPVIRVAATLYAVPFYSALGYLRTTGVRNGWSFEGGGLRHQPMKRVLGGRGPAAAPEK
jgi:GNAT superfamily N-acetyltransferase